MKAFSTSFPRNVNRSMIHERTRPLFGMVLSLNRSIVLSGPPSLDLSSPGGEGYGWQLGTSYLHCLASSHQSSNAITSASKETSQPVPLFNGEPIVVDINLTRRKGLPHDEDSLVIMSILSSAGLQMMYLKMHNDFQIERTNFLVA